MPIEVVINGKKEEIEEGSTIAQILKGRNIRPEMVAVEVNGEVVERDLYGTLELKQGDQMEFLFYMAGGIQGIQDARYEPVEK